MSFIENKDNNGLTISCSEGLKEFSKEFINYYNDHIDEIKDKLDIKEVIKIKGIITDDEEKAGFVYGKSDFSGFFTNTGFFAYINLYGQRTKDSFFKSLMHEIVHFLYKYYVYGENNKRIVWVDEGLAQLLSHQKDSLNDEDSFKSFMEYNINDCDMNLNELNHKDKSFGNNNGYNLSYIAVRYLYDNNSKEEFLNIIRDPNELIRFGESFLKKRVK